MMIALFKGIYKIFRCIREFFVSLFFILFVLVCIALVSLLNSDPKTSAPPLPQKGALTLKLDGRLADNRDELGELRRLLQSELGGSGDPMKISTFDVVQAIATARDDDRITGLVLDLAQFKGGDMSSLSFIGKEIEQFKQSNKPVIAIGERYTQSQYYLASFADHIYLNKAGYVELKGLSYSNLYFKSLLAKLEAEPYIFRVGTYKSAVEPFIRDDMSDEARQNAKKWLDELWGQFSGDVAKNRHIQSADVVPDAKTYLERYKQVKGDDAQYALKQQLVTETATPAEMKQALIERFGKDKKGNYNSIDFLDYSLYLNDRFNQKAKNKIAVVNVEGDIVWGESDDESAGSETIVKLLAKARQNEQVKGVILRVNSPGGSAVASELIRQEVEALQKAGKPVVASMGGMAASGGYWISATSDKIIASPNTLTGSIGIFGLAVNFEKTAKKIGISEDSIATSELANDTLLKPLSETQREIIQIGIENGYDRFLELVSRGRKMSKEAVDKVAQGQVWTGETALKHGLVDELGDFNTAYQALYSLINEKRTANGEQTFDDLAVEWVIEQDDDLFSQFMNGIKLSSQLKLAEWFNLALPVSDKFKANLDRLNRFNDPKHSYLYCLNCGIIQ